MVVWTSRREVEENSKVRFPVMKESMGSTRDTSLPDPDRFLHSFLLSL